MDSVETHSAPLTRVYEPLWSERNWEKWRSADGRSMETAVVVSTLHIHLICIQSAILHHRNA